MQLRLSGSVHGPYFGERMLLPLTEIQLKPSNLAHSHTWLDYEHGCLVAVKGP